MRNRPPNSGESSETLNRKRYAEGACPQGIGQYRVACKDGRVKGHQAPNREGRLRNGEYGADSTVAPAGVPHDVPAAPQAPQTDVGTAQGSAVTALPDLAH